MKIKNKLVLVVCALIALFLMGGCTEKETKIYGEFNDTQNIVLYDNDISFIGDKDKALNLDELLIDTPGHVSTNEVHCVTAERIYFSYSYYLDENDEKKFWVLSSVNWDGTELETIYKDEFTVSMVIHKRYETVIDKDYSYRNGFFANDKIVLSENGKVIEYDINTEKINVYENNYTFPSMGYDVSVSSDKRSVTMNLNDNTQKTINVDYIAKNILNKEPELCSIYYVQTCEEKLYLYVLYNQDSLTKNRFYLIEYDFKEDDFENIYSRYWVYDEYELCVVPFVDEKLTEQTTKQIQKSPVFNKENITRITFYAYGGNGKGSDVPEEDMTEIINWLGSFTVDKEYVGDILPGTNTRQVEIEYADGTVIKQGLDVIVIDGIRYYMTSDKKPECFEEIMSKTSFK